MLARQHGIRQKRDDEGVTKTLAAFLRHADEGTLSLLLVESSILLAASRGNSTSVLKDAASAYKVDTDAIAAKGKQEFTAKEKGQEDGSARSQGGEEGSLVIHPPRDGRPFVPRFLLSQQSHPHPLVPDPRSPTPRQESSSFSRTFPRLGSLKKSLQPKGSSD
jgi:hypothetical protein